MFEIMSAAVKNWHGFDESHGTDLWQCWYCFMLRHVTHASTTKTRSHIYKRVLFMFYSKCLPASAQTAAVVAPRRTKYGGSHKRHARVRTHTGAHMTRGKMASATEALSHTAKRPVFNKARSRRRTRWFWQISGKLNSSARPAEGKGGGRRRNGIIAAKVAHAHTHLPTLWLAWTFHFNSPKIPPFIPC